MTTLQRSTTGPGYLTVAVMQSTGQVGAISTNLEHVATRAREAAHRGAGVLVTPELFTAGYAPELVHTTDGEAQREQLAAIAAASGLALVASTVEHENGRHYITASLFSRNGKELTRYRKQHLFGPAEKTYFTPGTDAPELLDHAGVITALGICFDVEFPEFVRATAVAGTQLLCVPTAVPLRAPSPATANPFDTRLIPSMVVPTRALESQMYIAYANHAGPHFAGLSTIADPYGYKLATAADADELLMATISLDTLDRARADTDYLSRFTATTDRGTP